MADYTALGSSTYEMDSLSSQYKEFTGPSFQIIVDGSIINTTGLIITDLVVEISLEKADSVTFTVANAFDTVKKDFSALDNYLSMGKSMEIKIGYVDVLDTVFKGFVTSVRYELTEEETTVVVSGMDNSFKLMKGIKSRVFTKVKDSDVASQVISGAGLTGKVESTDILHELTQQVGVSDYQFLSYLASRSGYEFFTSGSQVHFRKMPGAISPVVTLTWGKTLLGLSLETDLADQTGVVTVRSWDAKTKKPLVGKNNAITRIGSGKDGVAYLRDTIGRNVEDNYHSEARSYEQVLAEANAIKNKSAMKLVSGEAKCIGLPVVRAGQYIKFAGLGRMLNDLFYITSVRHTIDESGFITTLNIGGNVV